MADRFLLGEYLDSFPPLDITVVANNIAHLWMLAMREAEQRARREFREQQQAGLPARFEFTVGPKEAYDLREKIIAQLQAFDMGRSESIKFYKQELYRLHSLMPSPIILPKPEPKTEGD